MKTLYINCPVKGRTEENIKATMEKMHKIAEIAFNQELRVVNPFNQDMLLVNGKEERYILLENLRNAIYADYMVTLEWFDRDLYPDCAEINNVVELYGVKTICLRFDDIAPDIREVIEENRKLRDVRIKVFDAGYYTREVKCSDD